MILLLERKAVIDERDGAGNTPMHCVLHLLGQFEWYTSMLMPTCRSSSLQLCIPHLLFVLFVCCWFAGLSFVCVCVFFPVMGQEGGIEPFFC